MSEKEAREGMTIEGEITEDGRLIVTLPPDAPRGHVRVTVELKSTADDADDPAQVVAEMERLWSEEEGDSHGWKWNREEAYDRPVLR